MDFKLANIFCSKSLLYFANAYILISIGYYWIETSALLNPVAIGLLVIFLLHLFVAKGGFKLVFPTIFIVINLYMFLALFSELSEFNTFNTEALIMLLFGGLYLGLNIVCALIMINSHSSISSINTSVE